MNQGSKWLTYFALFFMAPATASQAGFFVLQSQYLEFSQVWEIPTITLSQGWQTQFSQTFTGPLGGQIHLEFVSEAWLDGPRNPILRTTDLAFSTNELNALVDFRWFFDVDYATLEGDYSGYGSIDGYAQLAGYTGAIDWTKASMHCGEPLLLPIFGDAGYFGPPFGYADIYGSNGAYIGLWENNYNIETDWTLKARGTPLYGPTIIYLPESALDFGVAAVPEISPASMVIFAATCGVVIRRRRR